MYNKYPISKELYLMNQMTLYPFLWIYNELWQWYSKCAPLIDQ